MRPTSRTSCASANGAQRIEVAIRSPKHGAAIGLLPCLVAGFPTRGGFGELLVRVSQLAEVVEISLPFSDPVADGPLLAMASRRAIEGGVHPAWLFDEIESVRARVAAPLVLMSYVQPLLAFGLARACRRFAEVGGAGLILPDVPLEEGQSVSEMASSEGLALVQLATTSTRDERLAAIGAATRGFLYAVARPGTTGAETNVEPLLAPLARLRAATRAPLCVGFGLRSSAQLSALVGHADGAIVGTALIERLARGDDPSCYLDSLRIRSHRGASTP